MARKAQFKPMRQTPTSSFKLYVPGRGIINLDTTDPLEAQRKAEAFAAAHRQGHSSPTFTIPMGQKPQMQPINSSDPPTAGEMLNAWQSSPQSQTQLPTLSAQESSYSAPASRESSPSPIPSSSVTVADKAAAILPPDKRRKLAEMIAAVVSRVNVVAIAASVRLLGRIPGAEEDEESEGLLKEGWGMQLEEIFVEHPPAPWMVICAGSAAIGIGMYTSGTPIPKKGIKPPENPDLPTGAPNLYVVQS